MKSFFIKHYKALLFCLVFAIVCSVYNLNNQSINYFFKRGIVLEYSIGDNKKIDEAKLKEKLISQGIKTFSFKQQENIDSQVYDFEEKKITNILQLALPILATKNQENLINNISDFVFENHSSSKLLGIKTIGSNYHKPFSSLIKFLGLFITTLIVWIGVLYLFSNDKLFFIKLKNNCINYSKEKLLSFKNFCKETKQKGAGFFFKKLLLEESKDENGNEKEPDITKEIVSTIVFVLISVILIRFFIGELRWIPSGSMRVTILEKDRVFVEKLNFPTKKEIKRGDILVFYPPDVTLKYDPWSIFARLTGIMCKDMAFIKRAIGMPNDKFEIKYNKNIEEYKVYINDIPLNEPYVLSKNDWTPCNEKMHCGPFIIPEGHYFMMGDNRGNSQDSRFWGFLAQDRIIGRANFMFWPFSRINVMSDKYLELHKEKQGENYINYNYIVNRYELLYKIWHAMMFYSLMNILDWLEFTNINVHKRNRNWQL